jgi:SAM-dependent methyltransferase
MLAGRVLDQKFRQWNRQWGAPFGRGRRPLNLKAFGGKLGPDALEEIARLGMFAVQPNNDTRTFEYPWAYFAADLRTPMRVLEIGGGLSGFQFVLSQQGHQVDNVDPGMAEIGWPVTQDMMQAMNRIFDATVTLHHCGIEEADLPKESFDRAFSLSVIEHLPPQAIAAVMDKVHDSLKPGGLFILTVDLFLDLVPFSRKEANQVGRNVSIAEMVKSGKFELAHGNKSELYGYDEFDAQEILGNLYSYYVGRPYPTLVQTLILRRP